MPRKTRKSSLVNNPDSKTANVNRSKENADDSNLDNFSLPIISDEKVYSDDKSLKTGKVPRILIPKVRLTCLPLNIEKVIDLTRNEIIKSGTIKKKTSRKKKTVEKTSKKSQIHKPIVVKPCKKLRPRFKDEEEYRYLYSSPSTNLNVGSCQKKIKIYIKESKFILRKDATVSCKSSPKEDMNSNNESLKGKLDCGIQQPNLKKVNEIQELINSEVNDVNFDIATDVGTVLEETPERIQSKNVQTQSADTVESQKNSPVRQCCEDKSSSGLPAKCGNSDEPKLTSLQVAMEFFINNTQLENQKDLAALKKGLCSMWMSNNYKCTNRLCPYHHNALGLFTKKLKQCSARNIMTILLSLKNDILFVDAVLAAFKILSERKSPDTWVTFLIYFVFYVTEPSDSRFFKFWASAARFFFQLSDNFAAARGFASLLSIFSNGDKSEEWKIVEFIKFIKQPPIQVHTTYDLLQPVLHLDLPSQFLLDSVESCIATGKDVLEVCSLIIPKISIMTSPIPVIELLLKFCRTLESQNEEKLAFQLKQNLREKVRTFKIKIFHKAYPLTAAFQELILNTTAESNPPREIVSFNVNQDDQVVLRKNNYFRPENDFLHNIMDSIELNSKPREGFNKSEDKAAEILSKEEDSICERQVSRVKQFFADCHFDILGKYLNSLRPEVVEQTATEFLKALLQMKITLEQLLDLIRIVLLQCQSETAGKINASVCVTLIVNFVRINEWEKAHTILSLCEDKGINLVKGKVHCSNDLSNITQFRVLLLLIEIHIYKKNFQTALRIVKTHYVYSSNSFLWKLSWNNNDEVIRVRIMEEFLGQAISKEVTNVAFDLFMQIWKEQNTLRSPIDLGKFTNELLILLLNQNRDEGLKFFEKTGGKIILNPTATRAVLVSLIGQNNLPEAKLIMTAVGQTTYTLPEVTPEGATVTMSSLWLEEEIYVMMEILFDMLVAEMNPTSRNYENFEVNIHVVKPKAPSSSMRPLCLGLINSSLEHTCKRIERVLLHQFKPPVKLIIQPYSLLLDKPSLQLFLERRHRRLPV